MTSVVQDWVSNLTSMQQSVLLASIRGPDGIHKNHVSKKLCRWLRRCVLFSAFDRKVLATPDEAGGGSFTGPSLSLSETMVLDVGMGTVEHRSWLPPMHKVLEQYMLTLDEVPHHFQLHFLHAAEILGYTHPDATVRQWWLEAYNRLCNDMHLNSETFVQMSKRLGDSEADWRASEEVTAK